MVFLSIQPIANLSCKFKKKMVESLKNFEEKKNQLCFSVAMLFRFVAHFVAGENFIVKVFNVPNKVNIIYTYVKFVYSYVSSDIKQP